MTTLSQQDVAELLRKGLVREDQARAMGFDPGDPGQGQLEVAGIFNSPEDALRATPQGAVPVVPTGNLAELEQGMAAQEQAEIDRKLAAGELVLANTTERDAAPAPAEQLTAGGFDQGGQLNPQNQPQAPGPARPGGLGDTSQFAAAQRQISRAGRQFSRDMEGLAGEQSKLAEQRKSTLEDQTALALDRAQQEGIVLEKRAEQLNTIHQRQADIEIERQKQVAADMSALSQASEDLKYFNMDPELRERSQAVLEDPTSSQEQREAAREALDRGSKIDPGRLLGGARNKILAAIASALGTYASAYGVPNVASKMISDAIDRDILAQRDARDARRGDLRAQQNLYALNRQRFDDEHRATLATKIQMLELSETELARARHQYAGAEQSLELEKAAQEIEAQKLGLAQQFAEATANNAVRVASAKGQLAAQEAQIGLAGARAASKGRSKDFSIEGYEGAARNQSQFNEAADASGAINGTLKQIDAIERFVFGPEGVGRELNPWSDDARQADQMASTLQVDVGRNILKLGVLSGSDMKMLERIIPSNPTQWRQDDARRRFAEARRFVQERADEFMKARGYKRSAATAQAPPPGIQAGRI